MPKNRIKHLEKRIESLHHARKRHTEEIKDLRERVGIFERKHETSRDVKLGSKK